MATTSSPYGLMPIGRFGPNTSWSAEVAPYVSLTSNISAAVARGDLLSLSSGAPVIATATPTTTASANTPIGVVIGVQYTDPTGNFFSFKTNYLPGGAVTAGYTGIRIYYAPVDQGQKFRIQASGAVTFAAGMFKNAALTNFGAQTAAVGSKIQLNQSTLATTNTLAVKIVDFYVDAFNSIGDTYTDCIVMFNPGVCATSNATGLS